MKKILIIRSGAIGDTLMLMPLINGLTGYQITILGRKPGIDFLTPYVDQCIDIERGGWHRLFTPESAVDITCPDADHVIAFINDYKNIVAANLAQLFRDAKIEIFPPFPAPESRTHVVLHMACALESAGIPVNSNEIFESAINKPVLQSSKGLQNKIILHPGSGSKRKNYSPDFWFELLARIKKCAGSSMEMSILLGPAEEDIAQVIMGKAEKYNTGIIMSPAGRELLSILNSTYMYIGHDSGVTHLAAMMGLKTIALFKNSSVDQWRPLGPSVKIIRADGDGQEIIERTVGEAVNFLSR